MLWARKSAWGPSDAFFKLFMQFKTRLFVLRFGAVIKVRYEAKAMLHRI